ncbi:MAG: UDP-glucose dehydrogenase family protein [Microgenomates group bacterium]
MNISVVGAGYVGLTLAAVLADLGHKVWVVRKDKEKNEALKKGKIHFFELGLEELVKKNLSVNRFIPTTEYSQAIPFSEVVFIAVGTPSLKNGAVDLRQVFEASKEIGKNLSSNFTIIVNKSTSPPGTTRKIGEIIEKYKPKKAKFGLAFCPEFLKEGSAVEDTKHPDRVVIGTENKKVAEILKKLHESFKAPILITKIESAELIKYAANSYLALRIVFINQIADLCEKCGADIEEVIKGMGMDKRIGLHYWYPGLGYGGSCFPKDVSALANFARKKRISRSLFAKIHSLNKERIPRTLKRVEDTFGSFKNKKIGVLGLACKQGTDDIRESPAIKVINLLLKKKAKVKAYDPLATENAKKVLENVEFSRDAYEVAKDVDGLLILTDWPEFGNLNFAKIKKIMKGSFIFDSRNILDKEKMEKLGFRYLGVGR